MDKGFEGVGGGTIGGADMCVLLVDGDPCRFVKGAFESGGPKALLSGGLVECVAVGTMVDFRLKS